MMITKTKTFDVAQFLEDEETIAEYLNMALEDPNPETLLLAVRNIARARGVTQLPEIPVLDVKASTKRSVKALSHGMTRS